MRQHLVACMALLFVCSLVAVPAGGATGEVHPTPAIDSGAETAEQISPAIQTEGEAIHECAAEPPSDHADPDEDVVGWSNGYWYDESLDIDATDGLDPEEFDALVARTEARVEAIRCLPFEQETEVEVITREEFAEGTDERSVPDDVRTFDNVLYRAMLLVDEADPQAVQRENLETGVGGYYDPATDRIVVIAEDAESLEFDETVLAHELGHALQDQQFGLDRFEDPTIDGSTAEKGLIEGDVSYVEQLYEQACAEGAWAGTCVEVTESTPGPDQDDLSNVGLYLLSFQPYSDGPAFVHEQYEYDPGEREAGDWEPVDDLYEDPPDTSAEVIDPDRYPDYEAMDVTIPDDSTDDWERLRVEGRPDYETVGTAGLFAMFANPTFASDADPVFDDVEAFLSDETPYSTYDYGHEYVTGWDGDRLHAYENEAGETGYRWTIQWETEADARTFRVGYDRLLDEAWGIDRIEGRAGTYESDDAFGGAYYVDREGREVSIAHAPTIEGLAALEPAAESTTDWDLPQSTSDAETDEVPGFGIGVALAALVGALVVVTRRR